MCLQPLRAEEQVLYQAQEENAARTQLKILGNSRDKLLSTVQCMEGPMLDSTSCSQKTAQTLMGSQGLELASKTYEIMLEAWMQPRRAPADSGNCSKEPTTYGVHQKQGAYTGVIKAPSDKHIEDVQQPWQGASGSRK
jgi:hypothetical protein